MVLGNYRRGGVGLRNTEIEAQIESDDREDVYVDSLTRD
jgi:hypothetical protein